jgi:hypothetical protein
MEAGVICGPRSPADCTPKARRMERLAGHRRACRWRHPAAARRSRVASEVAQPATRALASRQARRRDHHPGRSSRLRGLAATTRFLRGVPCGIRGSGRPFAPRADKTSSFAGTLRERRDDVCGMSSSVLSFSPFKGRLDDGSVPAGGSERLVDPLRGRTGRVRRRARDQHGPRTPARRSLKPPLVAASGREGEKPGRAGLSPW